MVEYHWRLLKGMRAGVDAFGEEAVVRGVNRLRGSAHTPILAVLLVVMVIYYGLALTNGSFDLLHPTNFGLTFNSMLEHLLRGEFDVDPAVVGVEGFLRDGRVYAYWGIFCAVLRLPLLILPGGINTDITALSCLAGVWVGGYWKLRSLLLVARYSRPSLERTLLVGLFGAWLVFGGAQAGFLRTSIYQEAVFWAGAMAAAFVFLAIRGIVRGHFSAVDLSLMALLAGAAVNTRISTGIGLSAAFSLLLLVLIAQDVAGDKLSLPGRLFGAVSRRRVLLPLAMLALFFGAAGIVNLERWGNPFVFADYSLFIGNTLYPDRWPRIQRYGLFSLERVPLGLIYYLFPIWVLHGSDGLLVLDDYRSRLVDAAELPPASFLLTDLLSVLLIVLAWRRKGAWCRPGAAMAQRLAVAAGLAIPIGLMLAAIGMTYRYRMEFYPLLEFAGLLAIRDISEDSTVRPLSARLRAALVAATFIGIVAAHVTLAMYKLSTFGPGQKYLKSGIVFLYKEALHVQFPRWVSAP